ncbi:uncharacterized protein BDW43DRAFT_48667 [Aspergillus alliaceus]|uniref:uncharacterized protein n=1 Tax=Petromyces alliaceus TaxID=209559 RepID=UPI0012A64644|nr:uncharacterized protein BDW43DRAFT_48667 [Aspergillus alliaceus]KAB8234991.1 hypothetical protein BDW43DRAFT_48667 [Aspergillus alliaceus]
MFGYHGGCAVHMDFDMSLSSVVSHSVKKNGVLGDLNFSFNSSVSLLLLFFTSFSFLLVLLNCDIRLVSFLHRCACIQQG